MKKIIVYYPYHLREQKSGSAVRPVKMLKAFQMLGEQIGLEVLPIFGGSKERKQLLNELYTKVDPKDILFCYMENATIPIWLTDADHLPKKPFLDIGFLKYLVKNQIPLGIFYRDIYWKFDELYKVNRIIKPIMKMLFRMELSLYKKYSTSFYLPSKFMNKYVLSNDDKLYDLPPGGENLLSHNKKQTSKQVDAIYVGGINPRYGIYDTLEAFKKLNKEKNLINLTLICRKEEFQTYFELMSKYTKYDWLDIRHAFGEELLPYYEQSDFGIVPIKKDTYNDFAVPVKMFEYISYGLPVLATNCDAQRELVENSNLGIIVDDNTEGILNGLKLYSNEETRNLYKECVKKALLNEHLWYHRAKKVYSTLVK